MNRFLPLSVLFIIALSCTLMCLVNPCHSQGFYDMNTINSIQLVFSQPNWDYLLDSLAQAGDNARLAGTAIINGVQFDSVGVRYKGSSSYNPNNVKNPLNIKLDYVYEDQLLDGYGTITLSNGFKDPSFVRETLSFEIARKYIPSCLANYANVTINGQLIGLYDSVQHLDKYFLRTHYGSDDNAFFKGEINTGGPPMSPVVWGYYGSDSSLYTTYYDLQSDYGWVDLVNFLNVFNNTPALMENVLDVDVHIWMLAFDVLFVNLDAPINFAHNYYLAEDASDQFHPILSDLNECFGAFTSLLGSGGPPQNLTVTQMQQLTPFLNATNNNFPIIKKVLSDSTYKRMYVAHMKTLIAENISNNWYYNRAQQIQNIINATYNADPHKFYPYSFFQANLTTSQGGIVGLTQLMNTRATYLNSQPAFTAIPPAIAGITYNPTVIAPNATVWFNVTVQGATKVLLGHRNGSMGRFYHSLMYDDGYHNDGSAGDEIWGVAVNAGMTDIDYYAWAEDSDAGVFLPVRAAMDHFTAPVQRQLVINELMADNEATVPDPQGEFDDWIELYNGSLSSMSLAGMYLSDDADDPGKWAFPDTTIAPSGYLIIWADSDTNDAGLHANFSLNRDGETVGIYLADGGNFQEVDFVSFGLQAADISYGRFPNGTGSFVAMPPTFSAENRLDTPSPVVINEINYNSDSTFNSMDWVELVNITASTINLTGWVFKDGDDQHSYILPNGTILQPNQFLVLCEDTAAFRLRFPNVTSCIGNFNFGLSNGGELIRLYDVFSQIVDSLTYDDQLPWPEEPDGSGPTLELLDPDLPNFDPANWSSSVQSHGSPGQSNGLIVSPIDIIMTPLNPPIQIPMQGGNFQYNINLHNVGIVPVNLDLWVMMKQLPSGSWTGPYLNVNRTLPAGANPTRLRTQNIAGTLQAGNYLYEGRVGVYPDTVWDVSNFTFTKLSDGDNIWVDNFTNYGGDLFDEFASIDPSQLPKEYYLNQNYPNPCNPITTISFQLPAESRICLEVFDVSGRLVATLIDGTRQTGIHEVTFDGSHLSSGLYFIRMQAGAFSDLKKMVVLK